MGVSTFGEGGGRPGWNKIPNHDDDVHNGNDEGCRMFLLFTDCLQHRLPGAYNSHHHQCDLVILIWEWIRETIIWLKLWQSSFGQIGLPSCLIPQLQVNHFYWTQVSLGFGLWVPSLSEGLIHSLTFGGNFADVTLADDDTNSIAASWYGVEILNED